jgi:hypothetical protein
MGIMLFNGCSHTAGSEIEYTNQSSCYEKSWGKFLSNMAGDEYVNIAMAGSSNEYIFRTTQDWIIENVLINKSHKIEDLHVFVMWSGFDRKEIYFSDTNTMDNVNPLSDSKLHSTKMKYEFDKFKDVIVYFHDILYSNLKNLILVNNLSIFLDIFKIKYTFLNGLHSFLSLEDADKNHILHSSYINNLWLYDDTKKIKHVGFNNTDQTFFGHLTNKTNFKWSVHSKKGHFGEDAHEYWAKKVYEIINKEPKKRKLL